VETTTAMNASGLAPTGAGSVAELLNPESVAIIGMSAKPGSTGRNLLAALRRNDYRGVIHLVGRSGGEIDGLAVLTDADQLPVGVHLALIAVPAGGVRDAVQACVRRSVRTGIVYASGFAEFGDDGRAEQAEIARLAREGGLRLAGPNCIGYFNHVHRVSTVFIPVPPLVQLPVGTRGAVAVLAQSGGLMGLMSNGMRARGLPLSYAISTGNEAGLTLADYLDHLADDASTGGIVVYAEDIRDPQGFLRAVRRTRAQGKWLIVMHAGRSERGQQAAASHTGALAADYEVMKTLVNRAGAMVVESLEGLLDVAEILTRFPQAPTAGIGVATTSGAFCAIALDTLGPLGTDVPDLSEATTLALTQRMPSFMKPTNPLDLGTSVEVDPNLYHDALVSLLADDAIGSIVLAVPFVGPDRNRTMLEQVTRAAAGQPKPVLVTLFGDVTPVPDDLRQFASEHGMVVSTAPERMLRAMAMITEHGLRQSRGAVGDGPAGSASASVSVSTMPPHAGVGAQSEWVGKAYLGALGVPVPSGRLARSPQEAVAVAAEVGYPVAMKVQAAALQHKTEVGGLLLGVPDEAAVRAAWGELTARVAATGVEQVDGILVEEMAAPGLELVLGGRRHPLWGPVLLVGLGGIWVEALGDVRLIPPDLPEAEIVREVRALRAARLLDGFRGAPAVDLDAVARVVATIGRLMLDRPEIVELDINPLLARGDEVIALDVLIVADDDVTTGSVVQQA
jgi:acetate---CoA ligase (ADP-forming)